MSNGKIWGRSPALWLAVVATILNVLVVVCGIRLTGEQVAALNAFAVAVVGVIANQADPTAAGLKIARFALPHATSARHAK